MSLYNELRPMTLKEVKGQNNIKIQLSAMFQSGNVPNALLFVGTRGTGKTTIARIVARYVNCDNPQSDPCNECQSCKDILSGKSLDVVELDAASNNKVDDVHGIIEQAQYKPLAKKKVFILDEVHMLSTSAWNALLKILEEPPKDVIFVLCTTEEDKIPATIISRCRKFYFEKLDAEVIAQQLKDVCEKYGKAYEEDALKLIAKAADGGMRDALSILESFFDVDGILTDNVAATLGLSREDVVFDILEGVCKGDAKKALDALHMASSRGTRLPKLIKAVMETITDALFILEGADMSSVLNTNEYKTRLKDFVAIVDTDKCFELSERFSNVYANVTKSTDSEFLVEAAILSAIDYESELSRLKKRVDELAAKAESSMYVKIGQSITAELNKDCSLSLQEMVDAQAEPVAETEVTKADVADSAPAPEIPEEIPFDEDMPNISLEDYGPLFDEAPLDAINVEPVAPSSTADEIEVPFDEFPDAIVGHEEKKAAPVVEQNDKEPAPVVDPAFAGLDIGEDIDLGLFDEVPSAEKTPVEEKTSAGETLPGQENLPPLDLADDLSGLLW